MKIRPRTAAAWWCPLLWIGAADCAFAPSVPFAVQRQSHKPQHVALQTMSPSDQDARRKSLLADDEFLSPKTARNLYDQESDEFAPDDESPFLERTDDSFLDIDRNTADILEEREDRLYVDEFGIKRKVETCILVGVEDLSAKRRSGNDLDDTGYFTLEESMTEMRELIKTAGLELVGEITQRMNQVNPKTYVGTGKVEEANALLQEHDCCTIVFDAELSPGQQRALENSFNKKVIQNDFLVQDGEIKVIDRTALILDIFAQHAKTREGKLQVDLALHVYRKPRLTKMWTHLERQSGAGGVGLRGPGESQLEIDKRLIRDRIIVLKQKIDDVQKQRTMHRRGRERMGLPILSLVGYTNAGMHEL
jgi:hypothetical protein